MIKSVVLDLHMYIFMVTLFLRIYWVMAFGLTFESPESRFSGNLGCLAGNSKIQSDTTHSLTVPEVGATFVVWIVCLSVAILAFFMELIVFAHTERAKKTSLK